MNMEAKELHAELAKFNAQIAEENRRHQVELLPLNAQRSLIILTLAYLYHGVRPGVRVVHKGKVYEVKNVNVNFCDSGAEQMKSKKPWVSGRRVQKDGGLTNTDFNLYGEWELLK